MLGDEAQSPHYIETIPRRGYRLIATVESSEAARKEQDGVEDGSEAKHKVWSRRRNILTVSAVLLVIMLTAVMGNPSGFTGIRPMTARDYLLITEFSNQTGEPLFDATLRKAV